MNIRELGNKFSVCESVDMYDLMNILDGLDVSYVTELERDGKKYEAWFIHEKDNKGFCGKQIKDEKVYRDTVEKLKAKFPNDDIQVTSRKYKYAPEQEAEWMILLPIEQDEKYNEMGIGTKFKLEGIKGICTVVDKTSDGYWEVESNDNGYTNLFDLYPDDMDKVTLLNESVNESVEDDVKDHKNLAPEVDADKLKKEIEAKKEEKPKMAQTKKLWKEIAGKIELDKEDKKITKQVEESLEGGYYDKWIVTLKDDSEKEFKTENSADKFFKSNMNNVKKVERKTYQTCDNSVMETEEVYSIQESLNENVSEIKSLLNRMDKINEDTFSYNCFTIADYIRDGQLEGSNPCYWTLSNVYVDGHELSEFCGVIQDMILEQIAEQVSDGVDADDNFTIILDCERLREEDEWTEQIKKDLAELFGISDKEIADIFNGKDKEYEFLASYTVSVEEEEEENIEYVDEWQILYKNIEDQDEYFEEDEAGAYDRFEEVKPKVRQFIKKTYKITNNDTRYPEEEDVEVIYQDLDESMNELYNDTVKSLSQKRYKNWNDAIAAKQAIDFKGVYKKLFGDYNGKLSPEQLELYNTELEKLGVTELNNAEYDAMKKNYKAQTLIQQRGLRRLKQTHPEYFDKNGDLKVEYWGQEYSELSDKSESLKDERTIYGWNWIVTQNTKDYELLPCDVALVGINSDNLENRQLVAFCIKNDEDPKERYFFEVFTCHPDADTDCHEGLIGGWDSLEAVVADVTEWQSKPEEYGASHIYVDNFVPPSDKLIEIAERIFKNDILGEFEESVASKLVSELNSFSEDYTYKKLPNGAFDIPDIITSLKQDYLAGKLSIEDVAVELNKAGWTNSVDIDFAKKKMDEENINEFSSETIKKVSNIRQQNFDNAMADELKAKDDVNSGNDFYGTKLARFSQAHKKRLEAQNKLERNKELTKDESVNEAKLNKENSDYTLRYYADYSYDPVKNIYIDDMTLKEAIEFTINLDIPEDLNPNVGAYAILWDNKTDKKIADKESNGHYWINSEYQKMLK